MVKNMKALICTNEPAESGCRVAQVVQDSEIFGVAEQLFWLDCPPEVSADVYWFDPSDNSFKLKPEPEENIDLSPVVTGAVDL